MARIYHSQTTTYNGNVFRVELYDGASGSTTSGSYLPMQGNGFQIDQQGQGDYVYENFTRKSKAIVNWIVTDEADKAVFRALGVDQENKYAIVIWRNNALYWVGRVLADENQYERTGAISQVFSVTAVDALALLENYKSVPMWFDSITRSVSVIQYLRKALELTGLNSYYSYLASNTNYILDATESLTLETAEFNLNSTIADFELFQDQVETIDDADIYKPCSEVIEDLLTALGARLMYQNGSYWFFDPVHFATNNPISYKRYNTSGVYQGINTNYTHVDTLATSATRPQFESYPVITHHKALRELKYKYKREAFTWVVRKRTASTTSVLQVGGLTPTSNINGIEPSLKVKALLKYDSLNFASSPPKLLKTDLYYRIYGWDGSLGWLAYDEANNAWISSPTQPAFVKTSVDVINFELSQNKQAATYTLDFQKEIAAWLDSDFEIFAEFSISAQSTTSPFVTASTGIAIYGSAFLYMSDPNEYKTRVTNTNNAGASTQVEIDAVYQYGNLWSATQSTGRISNVDTIIENHGSKMMSLYQSAPTTIEGDLRDNGNYNAMRALQFDGYNWLFNGGTFDAQSEVWSAQWVRVAPETERVVINSEEFEDTAGQGDKTADALVRVIGQLQVLRDNLDRQVANLPFLMSEVALQAPTATPTINTDFVVQVSYVAGTDQLNWKFRERGKTKTLTAGTYTQDDDAELILCDTGGGSITVTLGNATELKGVEYIFKKLSGLHTVTIQATAIDDNGEIQINAKNESVTVKSDGVQWWIIAQWH